MKMFIACASALVLVAACGSSKEATQALEAMNLSTGSSSPIVHYASKSGSGDKVVLNDVVLGPGGGDGMKAKSMELAGLDVTKDGKPLVKSITLKDITPEKAQPGLTLSVATVSITDATPAVQQFMAGAFTKAGPGEPPPLKDWGFSKMAVTGLKVNGDLAKMGAGAAGSFNVSMDELSASSLKDQVFGAGRFAGLKGDFNIPAEAGLGFPVVGKFDFGAGDIKNLHAENFSKMFEAGMGAALDPTAISKAEAGMFANMSSPIDPGYDSLTWTPMSIEASGAKLTTSKVDMKATRDAKGVVTSVTSPRTTVSFTADPAGGQVGQMAGMGLNMLGYKSVELYGETDASFDPATDTTRYKKYNFGLTDGFDIQFTGGLIGLTKAMSALMSAIMSSETALNPTDPNSPPKGPDMSGLQALKVIDLDLTLTDKSIMEKIFNLAPMMGSQDPAALRNDIVQMLSSAGPDLAKAGLDPALSNELTKAVSDFIKQPGTLHIVMKPAQPVALAAPGAVITKQALGFSATNTPAPASAAPATPAPAKPN